MSQRGWVVTRILVALEDEYRAYREVLAAGVQSMRPGARVVTIVPASLKKEIARFDPQVIICHGPSTLDAENTTTWIELSIDPSRPTVVNLGGRRLEQSNPTFDELLAIVDETRNLTLEEAKPKGSPGQPSAERAAPTDG